MKMMACTSTDESVTLPVHQTRFSRVSWVASLGRMSDFYFKNKYRALC